MTGAPGDLCEQPSTTADAGRWELLRALGAVTLVSPPDTDHLAEALGLAPWSGVDHTRALVLGLPPHAAIYLGPEGKLGGEGADRVAGVWRALGMVPPADADHLGSILALYSELGDAAGVVDSEAARRELGRIRATVLWEHLWPWVPAYLDAVSETEAPLRPWAQLLDRALRREAEVTPGASVLPLALRAAPPPLDADTPYPDLLDALVAPVRCGFLLTHADLAAAAHALDVGLRRGERRFVLDAMLQQDAAGGLRWLAAHARRWADRHRRRPPVTADPSAWWASRAAATAALLADMARR